MSKTCPFGHIDECGFVCGLFDETNNCCGLMQRPAKVKEVKKTQVVPKADMDEVLEYFCVAYNAITDNDYMVKKNDFITVANLLKLSNKEVIKAKIDAMKRMIGNVWFLNSAADFNIGKLSSQFNSIIADRVRAQEEDLFTRELAQKGIA